MILIGLTGEMGSGKSTTIECLKEIQHRTVINIKFAQTLYSMQEHLYKAISPAYQRPKDFVKDRKLLQFLGTEWGRNLDKDLWTKLWEAEVRKTASLAECVDDVIITCDDVRFDNEAELIKKMGGHIIKLEVNKDIARIDKGTGVVNHASENGVDLKYVDYIIDNSGTVDDLKNALLSINFEEGIWEAA